MFDDRCLVVAEIAQAHDGSLGTAHAYVDAAARAGAGAVKFQTHIAEAESTPDEPWRVHFSTQDESRFDYWKRMEFSESHWTDLASHAREAGLAFVSSPFSPEAVELLDRVGVDAYKVASGEVTNLPLLAKMAETGRPVILSSGMSSWEEMDRAVETISERGVELAVLQCTSEYPCPPEMVGLNVITELRSRYGTPVGLSDHSGTIFAGLAAAQIGIEVLEVHLTMSRELFGPDVPASITTSELKQMIEGIRFIERANANPVDKERIAAGMESLRSTFTKSVVAAREISPGTVLEVGDMALKKPGTGLPPERLADLVGMVVIRGIAKDQQVSLDLLEPAK